MHREILDDGMSMLTLPNRYSSLTSDEPYRSFGLIQSLLSYLPSIQEHTGDGGQGAGDGVHPLNVPS